MPHAERFANAQARVVQKHDGKSVSEQMAALDNPQHLIGGEPFCRDRALRAITP
jgi:hypothetical protein